MLNKLQNSTMVEVKIPIPPRPASRRTRRWDQKLIAPPRAGGRLVTNDFNLNRSLRAGLEVININDLANGAQDRTLPREMMRSRSCSGRRAPSGVGYLDDGTMVVVEGATTASAGHQHQRYAVRSRPSADDGFRKVEDGG